MNDKLLKLLQSIEPELRKIFGATAQNSSVTISMDINSTHYNVNTNDAEGNSETFAKRIPRKG